MSVIIRNIGSRRGKRPKRCSAKSLLRGGILILLLIAVLTPCYSLYLLTNQHFVGGNNHHSPVDVVSSSSSASSSSTTGSAPDASHAASVGGQEEEEESSLFPRPLDILIQNNNNYSKPFVLLEPTYGTHRPQRDAVFCFAEGYPISTYALFIQSLKETGFDGDIVLSVSSPDKMAPKVHDYLKQQALLASLQENQDVPHVIVYTVSWECWKKNGEKFVQRGKQSTTKDGFTDCQINGLYGHGNDKGTAPSPSAYQPIQDPRIPRPVATARFELYWAWSTNYAPTSRILLIDARDTYFQRPPFHHFPTTTTTDGGGGTLHLYEENAGPESAASSIGASSYNSEWIRAAYGRNAFQEIKDRPVICSGSTIGDQRAIETYLRAMVKQFDDTQCKRVGCDQGLHNYLYYSGQLLVRNARGASSGITNVRVYPQGQGAVNNLAALRNAPLRQHWGILQNGTDLVTNWDGTISNVVHQFDRDKELFHIMKKRTNQMVSDYVLSTTT